VQGELVPYARSERREKRHRTTEFDEDDIRQIAMWRSAGFSLREIETMCEAQYGHAPSRMTIKRWTDSFVVTQVEKQHPTATPGQRAEIVTQYEAVAAEAWRIVMAYRGTELALKALDRVLAATRHKALAMGANMPVRVDHTVELVSETERELQEMLREAGARQAREQADVIRRASEDPDL
jgi:DNA-binding transcriptional MerR regulator